MAANDWRTRGTSVAGLLGWVAATGREAHQAAKRREMRQRRLTTSEREACADELSEQYALGRLDETELGRRIDLLHGAITHGDLGPVFAGLPMPPFYARPARQGRWRWVVFAFAAWLALPFVLMGLVFAIAGREVAAVVLGLPALVWVLLLWRWASMRSHSGRRGPGR